MKSGMVCRRGGFESARGRKRRQTEADRLPGAARAELAVGRALPRRATSGRRSTRGCGAAIAYSALDTYVLRGKAPWTLHEPRRTILQLKPASEAPKIEYPKPDGVLTFDRLSSVFMSNTNHEEDQPAHLTLKDPRCRSDQPARVRRARSSATARPASTRSCATMPAPMRLQINAQNCVHCKTCDIKDPTQNIDWVTPEGGGGPNYPNM